MEREELIAIIVKEVEKQLQYKKDSVSSTISKVVILWDDTERYEKLLGEKYYIIPYKDKIDEYDILIVGKLCLRGLSTLALGSNCSVEERFILKSLLKGKKVYILEDGVEYKRYKDTAPKTLYNLYLEYEKRLKQYGIEWITHPKELLTTLTNTKQITSQNNTDETFSFNHIKVLTESEINKVYLQGIKKITVAKNCIITPLAQDSIRVHHLEVIRKV